MVDQGQGMVLCKCIVSALGLVALCVVVGGLMSLNFECGYLVDTSKT